MRNLLLLVASGLTYGRPMPFKSPVTDPDIRLAPDSGAGGPIRLLVIEDDQDDQVLLYRQLRKANITDHTLFVSDGTKALQLLTDDTLSLKSTVIAVFLDLKLQGASGLEVLRSIRARPEFENLPVIIMTGSNDPAHRDECQRLKATSYIAKPISFQAFCMAIANVFHLPAGSHASTQSVSDLS